MDQATQQTIGTSPTGKGLLGFLAQEADVLRLKDLTRHPTFTGFPPHHPPMHSFLGASVRAHGRVFGRLYLTEKCGADEFTEIDEEVIASLAAQAGIAIENGYFLNQIRAAEAQYRTTMTALPVAVVRLDQHNTIRFANRLFYEFVQRNETDTIGQPIETLLPVEGLSELLRSVRANEAHPVQERECRIPGVDPTTCNVIAQNLRETSELVLVIEDITERKHSEQALRASEERFRQMAEHIKEVIWMTDTTKNQMLYINPAYEKIWGRACESLYRNPLSFLEAIHPDDRERVHAALSKQPSGEYDVEYRIITPDGSPRWICDRAFPIRDASGQVYRIVGIAEDISERKLAQEAIQHSRDFYLKLLDEFPTPIWKSGLDTKCDYFNKSWLSFTGRTAEQELGDGWAEGVHPEDLARCVDTYREAFRSKRPFEMEYRLRRHDNVYRSIIDIGRPFCDLTGSFAGYIGVCYDITERKNAEDALRRSEANLNRAQIVAHIGSWHLNIGKNELTWTDEAYRIFDVPMGTPLTYERFLECVHPDDTAYVHQAWTAALRGAPYDIEHRIVTGSEVRWVREKADLEFDEQGRVVAGIGITQDITERKRAEAALQASEEQLRQAQKMEAVGRLAGGIAHDFNNLLMVMLGYSDTLLHRLEDDSPLRRYPLEIKKASDRASSLTHQLLAFSRQQALEPKVLDLNDSVASMSEMLQRLIGEHIELVTALQMGIGCVKADPGQIEQVIMNLVINARDAMPEGGTLTVATDAVDVDETLADVLDRIPPGSYVMLAVSDTGHGMDAETQAHIFEPFFTTKEQGKGTGLGLASVYGIVKQSGGAILVKSAPAHGTTLTVYLPRAADLAVTATGTEPVREPAGGSETILLAEDEEMVRTLVRESLEEAGYRVLEARDGPEALALSARHAKPIHLLLTDVVMPHIKGRELAEQLIDTRPDMKILYLTGYTDDIVLQQGHLQENASVLHKPFLPETLLRKVRELLDMQHPE
ncbi:MAG: PAS domain S-box protein [Nitrospirae bacterium]|nr:MAG: PAS domain S-box protein [Nitrospirota bacterium]